MIILGLALKVVSVPFRVFIGFYDTGLPLIVYTIYRQVLYISLPLIAFFVSYD